MIKKKKSKGFLGCDNFLDFIANYAWAIFIVMGVVGGLFSFCVIPNSTFCEEEFNPEKHVCERDCWDFYYEIVDLGALEVNKTLLDEFYGVCTEMNERGEYEFQDICLSFRDKDKCELNPGADGCVCDEYEMVVVDEKCYSTINIGKIWCHTINNSYCIMNEDCMVDNIDMKRGCHPFEVAYIPEVCEDVIESVCVRAHEPVCLKTCKDLFEEHNLILWHHACCTKDREEDFCVFMEDDEIKTWWQYLGIKVEEK